MLAHRTLSGGDDDDDDDITEVRGVAQQYFGDFRFR